MKVTFYLLFAFLLMTSCNNDDEPNLENFDNFLGTWEIKGGTFQGDIAFNIPEGVYITFTSELSELIFNGNTTCNQYEGDVLKVTKNSIKISEVINTEIACDMELSIFESKYFYILPRIDEYTFEDNELVLTTPDNSYIRFVKK